MKKEKTTTVIWSRLFDIEQELVVAMFNNNGDSIGGREHNQEFSLWSQVTVNHSKVDSWEHERNIIWDATAKIVHVKGNPRMKIEGRTSSHGAGRKKSFILPYHHKLTLGAYVG